MDQLVSRRPLIQKVRVRFQSSVWVGFMVDKVAVGLVCLRILLF